MDFTIILTPQAIEDLREIVTFIARDNPAKAEEFGYLLCEKTLPLATHPLLGRMVPEFRRPEIREIIYKSYRIVYRVDESSKSIHVVHFWHGARGTPDLPQESQL
jgi:toxin ParE1/3/4